MQGKGEGGASIVRVSERARECWALLCAQATCMRGDAARKQASTLCPRGFPVSTHVASAESLVLREVILPHPRGRLRQGVWLHVRRLEERLLAQHGHAGRGPRQSWGAAGSEPGR